LFEFRQTVQILIYFNGSCFFITVWTVLVNVNYSIIHHYNHLIRINILLQVQRVAYNVLTRRNVTFACLCHTNTLTYLLTYFLYLFRIKVIGIARIFAAGWCTHSRGPVV